MRWIILGLIAAARGVYFVTEQPRSSLMPLIAYFRYAALVVRPLNWTTSSLSESQC